jgi:p-aminobenzoyl-glutamate transporter AbgT
LSLDAVAGHIQQGKIAKWAILAPIFVPLMVPYAFIVLAGWLVLFVAWYLIGIPLGPGWPV